MKAHHFGIIFIVFALAVFLYLDISTSNVKAIISEKNKIELSITAAIDDGVDALAKSFTKRQLIGSRDDGTDSFFTSLYASLGIVSDPGAQQKLRLYITAVAVTDSDGIYILFNDEYNVSGITAVAMRWSEKFPYSYEDDYFVYNFTMNDTVKIYDEKHLVTSASEDPYIEADYHEFRKSPAFVHFKSLHPEYFLFHDEDFYLARKSIIIKTINEKIAYYVNKHNTIASQYGISYNFSLPVIDESEIIRSVEQPGMIVIFQGYPLRNTGAVYNRVAVAGAQIYKKEVYFLEQKGWYKIYHKASCPGCKTDPNIDQSIMYYSVSECVKQGAYACETCCPEGVHVPDYHY